MFPQTLSLWLLPLLLGSAQSIRVETSQDFPLGSEIENMALRPCGSVLANVYTTPTIYEVPVRPNAQPKLIATFQNTHGVSSIAYSSKPDVYFVITGNFSFQTFSPAPKSYAIHQLSFDKNDKAVTKELARLDDIQQPNGMTHVPGTPYVLIADCRAGFVFRFNTETLELTKYFDHPLLKPNGTFILFGVNGIKLSRGYLYFSNTNQELVARIKASGTEPTLTGNPEIVVSGAPVDDFIVNDNNGDLFLAENGDMNALAFLGKNSGTTPEILIGGPNTTNLLFPTAAIWAKGAEGRLLIVSNSGDGNQFVSGNFTGGGKLNFVHVGGKV
ncbi:hypothetical protein BGZ60DRAFT_400185 [Tricladium varicosporioides]|nr:hypothetical protein BGZ60DRAFT_400185 [Hymenoscyphus varicosporioides]